MSQHSDSEFTDAVHHLTFSDHPPDPQFTTGLRRRRRSSKKPDSRPRVRSTSSLADDVSVNHHSVTVNSPILISTVGRLLYTCVTFPIWFVTDPIGITTRAEHYIIIIIIRFLLFCWHKFKYIMYTCFLRKKAILLFLLHIIKRILCDCIERKKAILKCCLHIIKKIMCDCIKTEKSLFKLCLQLGWGLLCSAFVGFILVGLLVSSFVIGGVVMKCVVEAPVSETTRLSFDYTRESPVAFVPVMSCFEPVCLDCVDRIGFGNVGPSRVFPPDHKLQATVELTLPESDYNRNLGNFQVRVDFLSSIGKFLASATQPCTIRFKSGPIRLLMMILKLAPLITGYSSESQTVHIKFNQYTEREIPTSCVRVALEPRAEFAKGRGVPQIYTAYLKLESQLPFMKRALWSWKATVFVWTGLVIFMLGSVVMMFCCGSWLGLRGSALLNSIGETDPTSELVE
ncbi:seipin-2-like [Bidens hawaiensis]|uniref:seipin-2-like n=1 Tax=Bidens hawaiensis TaxID=980011 RepID=UPI00404B8F13